MLKTKDGVIKFEKDKVLSNDLKERDHIYLRAIQLIFQNPDESLNPNHTVEEIVSQPLKLYFGLSGNELKQKIIEVLKKVRLGEFYLTRYPRQLSGGEKQRVAVARAMINKPDFIFLDEPTGNLDKKNAENIQELVINLCYENDVAIVVATHDNDFVNILDRKYILDKSCLLYTSPSPRDS